MCVLMNHKIYREFRIDGTENKLLFWHLLHSLAPLMLELFSHQGVLLKLQLCFSTSSICVCKLGMKRRSIRSCLLTRQIRIREVSFPPSSPDRPAWIFQLPIVNLMFAFLTSAGRCASNHLTLAFPAPRCSWMCHNLLLKITEWDGSGSDLSVRLFLPLNFNTACDRCRISDGFTKLPSV